MLLQDFVHLWLGRFLDYGEGLFKVLRLLYRPAEYIYLLPHVRSVRQPSCKKMNGQLLALRVLLLQSGSGGWTPYLGIFVAHRQACPV